MMWHVSPVACGPTIRLVEITFPEEGVLILKVFVGTVFWLKYGSASRKSCAAIWVLNEGLAPGANAEAPASRVDNTDESKRKSEMRRMATLRDKTNGSSRGSVMATPGRLANG